MFPSDTDGPEGWEFLPKIRKAGRTENWRRAVIGGEMEPGAAKKWLGDGFATTMAAIDNGHFSWVGPYNPGMEPDEVPEFIARSREMVRRMGYQYFLKTLRYTSVVKSGEQLKLDIRAENQGVAPFYYPWAVRLALLTQSRQVVATLPLNTDIRAWQPGAFRISGAVRVHAKPGSYQLAIGIIDPLTGQPDVKFANALDYSNGWTILSNVRIVH